MVCFNLKRDIFYLCKKCMKFVGVWPLDRDKYGQTIYFWASISVQIVALITLVVNPIGKCPPYEFANNRSSQIDIWQFWGIILKLSLRLMGNRMVSLIESTTNDWSLITEPEDREIMIQYDKYGLFIYVLDAAVLAIIPGIRMIIDLPFISSGGSVNKRWTCAFEEDSIWPQIISVMETIVVWSSDLTYWSTKALFWTFAMHLSGQFKILKTRFCQLQLMKDTNEMRRALRRHVDRHSELFALSENFQSSFNIHIGITILASEIYILSTGFNPPSDDTEADNFYGYLDILSFSTVLFSIFVIYYTGDYLTECCEDVSEALIRCNWYDLTKEFRINYSIVITRCRTPVQFTIIKIYTLNISSFKCVFGALFWCIYILLVV